MPNVVVGVLESLAQAERAVQELVQTGIRRETIAFSADDSAPTSVLSGVARLAADAATGAVKAGVSVAAAAGGVAMSLLKLGMPKEQAQSYADALRRGGVVLTVDADTLAQARSVADVLRRYAADVQETVYQPVYTGPERRVNSTPWLGEERRRAA
jgi:hypothetical protein